MSPYPVFRSIVVPVDGSSLAEGAIPYALALAERTQSKVRFVLVHPGQYPPLLIDSARVYLAELTERFRTRMGASLTSIILNGPAASSLVQHVRDIGADLVVMTTHGRSGIERAWLGSVADEMIRSIEVPVIVLRPRTDGTFPAFDMREILVPLDGSPLAETALGPAAVLAKLWDAEMSLVQMVYPVLFTPDAVLPFAGGYDEGADGEGVRLGEGLCARPLRDLEGQRDPCVRHRSGGPAAGGGEPDRSCPPCSGESRGSGNPRQRRSPPAGARQCGRQGSSGSAGADLGHSRPVRSSAG